jgi:gliding motility-associated-like protein
VCAAHAQLLIDNTLTPQQLVENVLLGGNVQATNIRFNNAAGTTVTPQLGTFDGTSTHLGMNRGVIMATGGITNATGPNDNGSSSELGGDYDSTDPDLVGIAGQEIHDAAILEFDFVPDGDSLAFDYIFASDEYPEFTCSEYNDVFGFFLSGPGITGPYTNNAMNIALVPSSTVPVAINTVNSGTAGANGEATTCAAADPNWTANAQYYVANGDGFQSPYYDDPQYVQYDGYTVTLTARAHVTCGETYHIKLCIADAFDDAYDSGVFLRAGSFNSTNLPPLVASTVTGDGIVAEGCVGSYFVVHRPEGVDTTITLPILLSGTATPGTDYAAVPSPLVIPAGQDSIIVDLHPSEDNLAEGQETAIITAYTFNACGDSVFSSATLIVADYNPMQILTPSPVLLHCDVDSVQLVAMVTGGYGARTVGWQGMTAPVDAVWVPGREDGNYTIVATDHCPKSVSKVIQVESGCEVVVPNVISPNGDGKNDVFVIKGILGKDNHLRIVNRWGQTVYETHNYRNTFAGRDLPDGTYYYVLKVEDKDYTGHLTILGGR